MGGIRKGGPGIDWSTDIDRPTQSKHRAYYCLTAPERKLPKGRGDEGMMMSRHCGLPLTHLHAKYLPAISSTYDTLCYLPCTSTQTDTCTPRIEIPPYKQAPRKRQKQAVPVDLVTHSSSESRSLRRVFHSPILVPCRESPQWPSKDQSSLLLLLLLLLYY